MTIMGFGRLLSVWLLLAIAWTACDAFAPSPLLSATSSLAGSRGEAAMQPMASVSLQAAQLLEFEEPTTGVKVTLVGTMHYNPASIQLTKDTIESLARDDKLGSVVIESCDLRWNQTSDMDPLFQRVLNSEMKTACDLALEYQRPVVLGDQRINETVSYIGEGFKETLSHLVDPLKGWRKFATSIKLARERALPFDDDANLSFRAIFDPQLLAAAPVSLAKYPLSYLVKSPLFTVALFLCLFLLDQQAAASEIPMDQMKAVDWVGSLGFAALETALFARVFLKELLADRNEILAQNILEQCKLYALPRKNNNWWNGGLVAALPPFLSSKIGGRPDSIAVYVDGSNVQTAAVSGNENEKEIVAVVGMAHSNGIMKLLKEQRV